MMIFGTKSFEKERGKGKVLVLFLTFFANTFTISSALLLTPGNNVDMDRLFDYGPAKIRHCLHLNLVLITLLDGVGVKCNLDSAVY